MKSKYFENVDGTIELKKDFSEKLTWKQAMDLMIEKAEFVKSILENGGVVREALGSDTCAGCYRGHIADTPCICDNCPLVDFYRVGGCFPIHRKLDEDRRLDNSLRLPHVRTALAQIKAVRESMGK